MYRTFRTCYHGGEGLSGQRRITMHLLLHRVLKTIRHHGMIRAGDRMGVGVSGGADSVALVCLLNELRSELGITLSVLHFNHRLRGVEADQDEQFVKDLAAEFQLGFIPGSADVAAAARRHGWNLEDAGRRLRYEFFASASPSHGLQEVAVAHTADDQAETVLAHLLRGTGLAGLAGIYPIAGQTIRPLLEIGREELRTYLRDHGREWREDSSNADTTRTRARIRHNLMPILVRDFGPRTVERLARTAGHAREEETFWRALEGERIQTLFSRDEGGTVSVAIRDLLVPLPWLAGTDGRANHPPEMAQLPTLALTRRLVRRIHAGLVGSRQPLTARHVAAVLSMALNSESGSRTELPGVTVRKVFGRLEFSKVYSQKESDAGTVFGARPSQFEYFIPRLEALDPASIVVTEIQRRFELKKIDWHGDAGETNLYRGALDFDLLRWPLVLRNWRPGDSYRPLGRRGARKLKRLFLESRVPRDARAGWPVLLSAGKLAWVSGYPAAEEFAARPATRMGLLIAEERIAEAYGA